MHDTDAERDAIFVEQYIKREGRPDAHIVACINSQIRDNRYPMAVTAENQLNRPEIQAAISAIRRLGTSKPTENLSDRPTADTIIADTEDIYKEAFAAREFQHCLGAKRLQADVLGLNKTGININTTNISVLQMSDEKLLEIINRAPAVDADFVDVTPPLGIASVVSTDRDNAASSSGGNHKTP